MEEGRTRLSIRRTPDPVISAFVRWPAPEGRVSQCPTAPRPEIYQSPRSRGSGGTTTALAGALTGFYAHIPVAHVEARSRSRSIYSPFPEEANRRLITRLAAVRFAPTKRAAANLLAEGVPPETVHVTGYTAIDALYAVLSLQGQAGLAGVEAAAASELAAKPAKPTPSPTGAGLGRQAASRMLLVTTHRREN